MKELNSNLDSYHHNRNKITAENKLPQPSHKNILLINSLKIQHIIFRTPLTVMRNSMPVSPDEQSFIRNVQER